MSSVPDTVGVWSAVVAPGASTPMKSSLICVTSTTWVGAMLSTVKAQAVPAAPITAPASTRAL